MTERKTTRRRSKKLAPRKSETRGEYLKRFDAEARERLRGQPITTWVKGGRTITVEPAPPFNRAGRRSMFGVGTPRFEPGERRRRMEGTSASPFTKPPLGRRRARRRAANASARRARRANRR